MDSKILNKYENIFIAGNFNCNLEKINDDQSIKTSIKILTGNSLIDTWSNLRPGDVGYTWCNGENVPKSRIDYALLSDSYAYQVKKTLYSERYLVRTLGERECLIINVLK